MEWLGQNWIFLLLVIGVFYMMRRMGCGPSAGRHRHSGHEETISQPAAEATMDPVSEQSVDTQTALTSVYLGNTYYFASRENRDHFETAPEEYVAKLKGKHGQKHGCC